MLTSSRMWIPEPRYISIWPDHYYGDLKWKICVKLRLKVLKPKHKVFKNCEPAYLYVDLNIFHKWQINFTTLSFCRNKSCLLIGFYSFLQDKTSAVNCRCFYVILTEHFSMEIFIVLQIIGNNLQTAFWSAKIFRHLK